MEFTGKCIIVTGSSRGIGRATALAFAKRGASVLLHGRDQAKLTETLKKCEEVAAPGAKFPVVIGDVVQEATLENILKTATTEFRRIDVLVNNAGAFNTEQSLINSNFASFDYHINLLLRSPMKLSQLCFPELKKTSGNIVNISSTWGIRPTSYSFYSIAKAGVNMFTQCGALEFGSNGVRINAVCPGDIYTDMLRQVATEAEAEEYMEVTRRLTPLKKIVTVEDVAKAVVYLASDSAAIMNGVQLAIDGGNHFMGLDDEVRQYVQAKVIKD